MPLVGAADPLPRRPERVLIAGTSGAGKTTLAGAVAADLDSPHESCGGPGPRTAALGTG